MGSSSELLGYVRKLRARGCDIRDQHGGGWIEAARWIVPAVTTRKQAKHILRQHFNSKPAPQPPPVKYYASWGWKRVRYETLKKYGARCMLCGATPENGARICVDHIQPVSKRPDLALDPDNLQVLCDDCNMGKSNVYTDDFRPADEPIPDDAAAHLRAIMVETIQ